MKLINKLTVTYHNQIVGTLSMTPDNRLCAFQYSKQWLANGFSISPLDLPLKPDLFIARPEPFWGNFGIFEDSLPDGYGRYLLHCQLIVRISSIVNFPAKDGQVQFLITEELVGRYQLPIYLLQIVLQTLFFHTT